MNSGVIILAVLALVLLVMVIAVHVLEIRDDIRDHSNRDCHTPRVGCSHD